MPYSAKRKKSLFSPIFKWVPNRIRAYDVSFIRFSANGNVFFAISSYKKKTGWWEGNCLIYEYIYFGLRIVITKTKKRVLCVTLARTHALENLFQFFQSSSTFSSFRLLLLIVADSIPVSSSIFGILMVHFSRNAYFSMQSHSLVREPTDETREKKNQQPQEMKLKKYKKVTTTKTAKKTRQQQQQQRQSVIYVRIIRPLCVPQNTSYTIRTGVHYYWAYCNLNRHRNVLQQVETVRGRV